MPRNPLALAISIAMVLPLAIAQSATAADTTAEEVEPLSAELEIVVEDYAPNGKLRDVSRKVMKLDEESVRAGTVEIVEPPKEGEITTFSSGNTTISALSYASGCRNIYGTVKFGVTTYYYLKNNTYFCYTKATKKVTNASASWTLIDHDGASDISEFTSSKGYYNYNSWGTSTGYLNKRTWKVLRTPGGPIGGTYSYYPRIDVYVHGDSTGYVSWTTD